MYAIPLSPEGKNSFKMYCENIFGMKGKDL